MGSISLMDVVFAVIALLVLAVVVAIVSDRVHLLDDDSQGESQRDPNAKM